MNHEEFLQQACPFVDDYIKAASEVQDTNLIAYEACMVAAMFYSCIIRNPQMTVLEAIQDIAMRVDWARKMIERDLKEGHK